MAMNDNRITLIIDKTCGSLELINNSGSLKQVYIGIKEAHALAMLLTSHGWRCPKNKLKEVLWPDKCNVDDNLVAIVMSNVRKSLVKIEIPLSVKAITNYGYRVLSTDDVVVEFIGH
ncbi:helix-turn-helix domain-containing protein (plasmid) [Aeromonas dhakensis]|uniref:helix-turn-helix domain-containing protein n=1 Tax=Aeromonas dhakensis TaxID=196024 RepID=UPI0021B1D714|nr:helix-turn-helix domain-containing protein [Aeromonas dhakensis]UXB09952.1 helix-turn-helix domain-containing protein [Aeromonas dhakensis]